MTLTQKRLKDVLAYDQHTGVFTWKIQRGPISPGSIAGTVNSVTHDRGGGYRQIYIDGRKYYAHRLAILFVTGEWPAAQTDHVNMLRDDNRFVNLRPASRAQNNANRVVRPHRTGGRLKGAWYSADKNRWRARISVDGNTRFLGWFMTEAEAHKAYLSVAVPTFGEFFRKSA